MTKELQDMFANGKRLFGTAYAMTVRVSLAIGMLLACFGYSYSLQAATELDQSAIKRSSRQIYQSLPQGTRVAVRPFFPNQVPVEDPLAKTIYDAFLASLFDQLKEKDGIEIILRENLNIVSDATMLAGSSPNELLKKLQIDALVILDISLLERTVRLSARAVSIESGKILTSAKPREIADDYIFVRDTTKGRPLDAVMDNVADDLGGFFQSASVADLSVKGIFSGRSERLSTLSLFVMDALETTLRSQGLNPSISSSRPKTRGISVSAKQGVRPGAVTPKDYAVEGNYWVFDDHVQLKMRISGSDGTSKALTYDIRKESLPKGFLDENHVIGREAGATAFDDFGPLGLTLSSNKGASGPAFFIGDTLVLSASLKRDGFLYCFYRDANKKLLRIFPNDFYASNRLASGRVQSIPSERMPFQFDITGPIGTEFVHCFATDKPVANSATALLSTQSFNPIDIDDTKLFAFFNSLSGVKVSQDSLVINVLKD